MSNHEDVSTVKTLEAPEEVLKEGMGRRRFLQLLSAGGAAAVLTACNNSEAPPPPAAPAVEEEQQEEEEEAPPWFKDPAPFIEHGGKNLEARLENMGGFLTPNELFFVRNNSVSLELDAASWKLSIEGDAVESPLELTYEQILNLPSRTVFSYIECGGNQRGFFEKVMGQAAKGTQWGTGGVSMATWTGVPLAEVLALAGVKDKALDVQVIGLDVDSPEEGFRRAMPIEKALDPDTILAYRMNGAVLPPDHGYPLRAVVPGWVGSNNVKWLGKIEVSSEKVWSRNNTTSYVLIGEDYPPEGEAEGKPATTQAIKSALALPWPGELKTGSQMIRGYAQSPHAPIAQVEWSTDEGQTWQEAQLLAPPIKYAWAPFEFQLDAEAGEHTIMTRATDEEGNTQPDEIPFNQKGYLFNQPLPHPVKVS
jgi:DMSO/TMAO reductase YedYZ molybdopterin-dependent catalytic subunit